jgi:hypothetical protein
MGMGISCIYLLPGYLLLHVVWMCPWLCLAGVWVWAPVILDTIQQVIHMQQWVAWGLVLGGNGQFTHH